MQRPTAVYQLCQILIKWMFACSVSVIWCLPRNPSSYIFAQVFDPCYLISYLFLPLLEQPCLLFLSAIACSTRYSFPIDSPLLGLLRGKKLCMVAGDYSPVCFSMFFLFFLLVYCYSNLANVKGFKHPVQDPIVCTCRVLCVSTVYWWYMWYSMTRLPCTNLKIKMLWNCIHTLHMHTNVTLLLFFPPHWRPNMSRYCKNFNGRLL
jgi:hypothetical protein